MYKITFLPSVQRYLKKLTEKELKLAFKTSLEQISTNPYCGTAKTGDLNGVYCLDLYYNRTNYEIAYRIYEEDNQLVVVILAGTRENFYNELKRYIK